MGFPIDTDHGSPYEFESIGGAIRTDSVGQQFAEFLKNPYEVLIRLIHDKHLYFWVSLGDASSEHPEVYLFFPSCAKSLKVWKAWSKKVDFPPSLHQEGLNLPLTRFPIVHWSYNGSN